MDKIFVTQPNLLFFIKEFVEKYEQGYRPNFEKNDECPQQLGYNLYCAMTKQEEAVAKEAANVAETAAQAKQTRKTRQ